MNQNNKFDLHDIVCRFIRIDRKHRKAIEEQANKFGIHRSQHRLLMYLSCKSENLTQRMIADELEISPSAVAVTLKKLEKAGLIIRESIDKDNRANNISLSDKGKNIVERSKIAFENVDIMTFNNLSEDEITLLLQLLNKIENNLDERKK